MVSGAHFSPKLTPRGHLFAVSEDDAAHLDDALVQPLTEAFAQGSGVGLLYLGTTTTGRALPPAWAWWRDFAVRYVAGVCANGEDGAITVALPDVLELELLIADAPPMSGGEYLSADLLGDLWWAIETALTQALGAAKLSLREFLKARNPAWNLVGRVHFNLAENRKGELILQALPTLSIGAVTVDPGEYESHREVAAAASVAKKQAKKAGKNQPGDCLKGRVFLERRRPMSEAGPRALRPTLN